MRLLRLNQARTFKILAKTPRSQAAEMVIRPGDSEGGPDNRHPKSDQWLFVTAGTGKAVMKGRSFPLRPGSLLLIEKNEPHEIHCVGRRSLRSLNVYSPPAY